VKRTNVADVEAKEVVHATATTPLQLLASADARPPHGGLLQLQGLIGNRAVARLRGGSRDAALSHQVAAAGIRGVGRPLPHLEQIQAAFGGHDVRQVRAFTGGAAATTSEALGAEAYATRERIAFRSAGPSLHTTAHEAAHIIQQRRGIHLPGGFGRAGDSHERHADLVADRVVRGQSAESLLGRPIGPGSFASPTVQRAPLSARDLGRLYAAAEMDQTNFTRLVSHWAKETGGAAKVRHEVKDMGRLAQKVREKAREDGIEEDVAIGRMYDVLGGTIVYKNLDDFFAGYNKLKDELAPAARATIVRLKNRITQKNNRDFLINIKLESGFIVELQLHLEATLAGKQGDPVKVKADRERQGGFGRYTGHDAYDYTRILEGFFGAVARQTAGNQRQIVLPGRKISPENRRRMATNRNLAQAQGDQRELAAIKADLRRPFVQKDLNKYYEELTTLYNQIQDEITANAWEEVLSKGRGRLNDIEGIHSIDTLAEQDLGAIGEHWKANGDTRALINTRYRKFLSEADAHANAAAAGPASMLATFRMYYNILNEKHEVKKKKKANQKVPAYHAKIDTYLKTMASAIKILEAQEEQRLQLAPQQPQQLPQQQAPAQPQ
jgi:hypothetical protein